MSVNKYYCPRCHQCFPKKYNLMKHYNRKNPCTSNKVITPEALDLEIAKNPEKAV